MVDKVNNEHVYSP